MATIEYTAEGIRRVWNLQTARFTRYQQQGDGERLVEERDFGPGETDLANLISAVSGQFNDLPAVVNAITTDRDYIVKVNNGTATQADHITQIGALTRQVAALLVRVLLRDQN